MTDVAVLADHIRSMLPDFGGGEPSFFGDWHGRPGDRRYRIMACDADEGALVLRFDGDEVLTVWSPADVIMDRQAFRIPSADRVRWEWSMGPNGAEKRYFLDYVVEERRCVATTSDERIRYLRPSLDKPAVDISW